jgi:hypothetical protein
MSGFMSFPRRRLTGDRRWSLQIMNSKNDNLNICIFATPLVACDFNAHFSSPWIAKLFSPLVDRLHRAAFSAFARYPAIWVQPVADVSPSARLDAPTGLVRPCEHLSRGFVMLSGWTSGSH